MSVDDADIAANFRLAGITLFSSSSSSKTGDEEGGGRARARGLCVYVKKRGRKRVREMRIE